MSSGRLRSLDAIRAIAVTSMIFGHVSNYSFLWLASHPIVTLWDGASLFVLVSGLVVGVVYRKRLQHQGMASSAGKLIRRAGFLYIIQLVLVSAALVIAYLMPSAGASQFRLPGIETLTEALIWALVLGANPIYVNFLSLYVVLLVAVIPVLFLLKHGRFTLLASLLLAMYALGLVAPQYFSLPNGPTSTAEFNLVTWFVLFSSGVVAGWVWRSRDLDTRLRRTPAFWVFGTSLIALGFLGVATTFGSLNLANWWLDKGLMAPLRFFASWVFFVGCYWFISWLDARPRTRSFTDQMAILGARSLDAVVILSAVTIISQGLLGLDSATRQAQILAIITLAASWLWAHYRSRLIDKV